MRLSILLAGAMIVAHAVPSLAQGSADPAAATELFRQGRDLMQRGDVAAACGKFSDSVALDEKVGTLLNLAECEDKLGRIAGARWHLQRAIDLARAQNDDRVPLAQAAFEKIDKRVPRLTIKLGGGAPADTTVKRDNVPLGDSSLGSPLPIEPGKHVVVVSGANRADRTFEIVVAEGETHALDVFPGDVLDTPKLAPVAPVPVVVATRAEWGRPLGIATVGLGLGALAGGAILGGVAIATNGAANENHGCGADPTTMKMVCDDQRGIDLRNQARTAGDVATVLFVAGTALAVGGIVLWLAAPRRATRAMTALAPFTF